MSKDSSDADHHSQAVTEIITAAITTAPNTTKTTTTTTDLHIDEMIIGINVLFDETTDTQKRRQQLPLLLQTNNKSSK